MAANCRGTKLNHAALTIIVGNVGASMTAEAMRRIDQSVRTCLAVISNRKKMLAAERADQCVRVREWANDLYEVIDKLDNRNKRRFARALGDDFSGSRASRRREGRRALRNNKEVVDNLCSASMPALERANDEIYCGDDAGDAALLVLFGDVWKEWRQATAVVVNVGKRPGNTLDKQVEKALPFFREVLKSLHLDLRDWIVTDLISYSITNKAP